MNFQAKPNSAPCGGRVGPLPDVRRELDAGAAAELLLAPRHAHRALQERLGVRARGHSLRDCR